MVILDKVVDAWRDDGITVELGLIEGYWVLAVSDDLGDDLKTYTTEERARTDFNDLQNGLLRFQSLFGFVSKPLAVAANVYTSFQMSM